MISSDRPILDRWRATPWVAATPVDDRSVGGILQDEVQVAFRGDGPMSSRELVPLTRGAHELLYGPTRDAARTALRGVLATLDGQEGAANLRGMSLSSDQASFATNLLMSNTEAGFFPDSVAAGDAAGFERSMVALIPSVKVAKAQNTGWIDLGPRVSAQLRDVIERGSAAGSAAASEVALTFLHELQHSVSPHDPNTVDAKHVWLEEGIAETLAWWPGQAAALRARMGVPPREGEVIDPWTAPPDSVASTEYRSNHRAVQRLVGLAGVEPVRDDGTIDPAALARARELLQGDVVDRVPRALARAIVGEHRLRDVDTDTLAGLIVDTAGQPPAVEALAQSLGISSS
jgi:hypothetical protein